MWSHESPAQPIVDREVRECGESGHCGLPHDSNPSQEPSHNNNQMQSHI